MKIVEEVKTEKEEMKAGEVKKAPKKDDSLDFIDELLNNVEPKDMKKQLERFPDCSICFTSFKVEEDIRIMPICRHIFHMSCIDSWLKIKGTCPMDNTQVMRMKFLPFS